MATPDPAPDPARTRRVALTVELGREAFTFDLCARRIALGPDHPIDYFWMDSTGFASPGRAATSTR